MRLGIIGLPQAGKTTIFNALTRGNQPTTTGGGRFEVHTAVVDVPDPRLDRLSELFQPKKTTYVKVTYSDIAGLDGSSGKTGISGALLNQLSQMDGFLHVVRCFDSSAVPHAAGSVNPLRDLDSMDTELIINDLISVERKLERLNDERRKGGGRDRAVVDREILLFEKLQQALSAETPLRDIDLTPDESKQLTGYGLLTRKPVLILFNVGEGQDPPAIKYQHLKTEKLALQGKLEMEIAQLPNNEAEVFLQEYGIEEPGLDRVIRYSYQLMDLQSFFTVGEDEVRAWTIDVGGTAFEAAGIVHSDLQRGFIRAEVIHWEELLGLGGLSEARSKGKLRLEGKEYIVKDGEIVHIRFNI
jgi:ribosome-binding ATPase